MNDMNDMPAWATDPRGLPPAVQNRSGRTWGRSGETSYAGFTPTELEALHGPLTPLWPDTPPTSPMPDLSRWHAVPVGATIPEGTLYATYYSDERMGLCVSDHDSVAWMGHYYTEHPIAAPDAEAESLAALVNARVNPLSVAAARALIDAIQGARR